MDINLDEKASVLYLKPSGALKAEDFAEVTARLDTYLKHHGMLKGVVIETLEFPGWANIKSFVEHVKFVKNHHARIQKIAIVTNSKMADIAKTLLGPFISTEIKHFPYGEVDLAKQWIEQ